MSWKRPFEDPIALPRGRQIVTLQDAGNYITKLPKAEHSAPEWQTAMEMLIRAAERGGGWMWFARIAVLQALHRNVERVFNPDRKDIIVESGSRAAGSCGAVCPAVGGALKSNGANGTNTKAKRRL